MDSDPFIDFDGRVILVTGASSGIGRAIAVELGRRGAAVILSGRDVDRLNTAAEQLKSDRAHVLPMDLRTPEGLLDELRSFVAQHGRIYGLCHSAGVVETRPLNAIKREGLQAMMDVNVTAGLELARCISRRDIMVEDGGSILLIASVYAHVGMPGQIGYCATKGAVVAAARAMAVELARRAIRVNTLSPGLVRTPMTESSLSPDQARQLEEAHPLGSGAPEDVAHAAAFLLAPQSRWITGIDMIIDGGYTAR